MTTLVNRAISHTRGLWRRTTHSRHFRETLPTLSQVRLSTSSTGTSSTTAGGNVDHLGSYDSSYSDYKISAGDPDRREFVYLALGGARFLYASAVRLALMKVVGSMSASSDVLALANLEVELDSISKGDTITVKWRGKPVFIKHRTEQEISDAKSVNIGSLRDQQTDEERVQQDDWLVALGICTHLGCVPVSNAGEYAGGWYCPCHGSHYDSSGRIRKGPAPLNLEIPPYKFIENNSKLILG